MAKLGVAGSDRAQLAEILDLIEGHIRVARQMQQRIKQHRAVARRQNEPVAVRPVGGRGVEFQVFFKQNRGHIRHAHRHARVPGIRGGDRVQGEHADCAGFVPVISMIFAQAGNIHDVGPPKAFG